MKASQSLNAILRSLCQKLLFMALLVLSSFSVDAQKFGGNPPAVRWWQVRTPAARIIFPAGLDSSATRVANIMQHLQQHTQPTIGNKQAQINVVLQNQTTISNAYVGLAPFRSEFYLTPEQNSFELGSIPWLDQLALHEFRHVQQYINFNTGLSKVASTLFGEFGQGLANSMAIPDWFFEGDAVFNETQLSQQGRGRLPYFFKDYRAIWAANKNYSWMKLRNGSYRDDVPDHYQLGYLLVAYGRDTYGDAFWKNVTQDAAAFKGLFYPLQRAVKKYASVNYRTFRKEALHTFKQEFELEQPVQQSQASAKHFVANIEHPAFVNDSTLVYVKTTYSKVPAFMLRSGKVEKQIRVRDASLDNYFSFRNGKIVYAAYRPHVRWGNKNFTELQLLDIKTGKQRTLTHQSKYFAPDISEDGKTMVAVQVSPDGKSELHLIQVEDGKISQVIPNPDNLFYTYPKFDGQQHLIAAVRNTEGKMALARIHPDNGQNTYLTPFSFQVIGFPEIYRDTIYFTASAGKTDRLFAFSLQDHQLFQLKQEESTISAGNYQPAVSENKLAWTNYTATGFELHQAEKKSMQWEAIHPEILSRQPENFGVHALARSPTGLLEQVPEIKLPVGKYRKSTGLFNFHSLDPAFDDPNYSLTLLGQNVLNTLQTSIKGAYNRNEQYKQLSATAMYGAWFPYLSLSSSYLIDRRIRVNDQVIYYNEWKAQAGMNLPLNLSKGSTQTTLNMGADYVYDRPDFRGVYAGQIGNRTYSYLNSYLTINSQALRAKQPINPRFGQSLTVIYKHALTRYDAHQLLLRGNLFFPGLFRNHSLLLAGAFQQKDNHGTINFSNDFPFSRGYSTENLHQMKKWSVNYLFPIAYPDAGLANMVYLLRLRGNLFYDQSQAADFHSSGKPFQANFRSAGTEVFFDAKLWNQLPVTFGIRYIRLLDQDLFGGKGANRFELVLPVSLF